MKKYRIIAFLTASVVLLCALSGCNKTDVGEGKELPTVDGSEEISYTHDFGAPFDQLIKSSDKVYDGVFNPDTMTDLAQPIEFKNVNLTFTKGFVVPETLNGQEVKKIEYFKFIEFKYEDAEIYDWNTEWSAFMPGESVPFIYGDNLELDSEGVALHLQYIIYFAD